MRNILKKFQEVRFLRFLIIGFFSTGIDFMLYFFLSERISITISKGIAMTAASVFSYFANKKFTFRDNEKTNIRYLVMFYIVFAANIGVNVGINALLFQVTHHKLAAYGCATAAGMTVNYLGQRFWVFNRNNKKNNI